MGVFSDKGSLNFRQAKTKQLQIMGFEGQSCSLQFVCCLTVCVARIEFKAKLHVRTCEHKRSNSGTLT